MQVGLIGTGQMGYPMAEKVLEAGFPLAVYNRTRDKAAPLADRGARVAESAEAVLAQSDGIVLMLTDAASIAAVLDSIEAPSAFVNKTIIQMSTIAPSETVAFEGRINAAGGEYFEAPVLGSIKQIRERTLQAIVGGRPEHVERWKPLFECWCDRVTYIGPVGQAAGTKLALNQLIASLTGAFSLSLGYLLRTGVDHEPFMAILRDSALYAPTFDKKLPLMLERNFTPANFFTQHLLKDVDLFLGEAKRAGLNTADLDGLREVIADALERGMRDHDYSSLYNAVNPK